MVSIAFRPSPTTSVVLFSNVAVNSSYGSPSERFDYIEDLSARRSRSDRVVFQPGPWEVTRRRKWRAAHEEPVRRIAGAVSAFPNSLSGTRKPGSGAHSIGRPPGFSDEALPGLRLRRLRRPPYTI